MNIVIIDDTELNAKLIATYVSKLDDIQTSIFTDPVQGLNYCLEQDVDIILVDYKMPELDGLELVRRVRAAPEKSGIPIVMITGIDERNILWTAMEAGANDFLTKPVDELELIARVRNMLSIRAYVLELKRLATIDSLTSVYNRRYFLEQAEKEFSRARRYGSPLSLLVLDADRFKRINDTYGHACGDEVLTALAHTCSVELRDVDFMGRIGGEEFAACLSQTDINAATRVAERLRSRVEDSSVQARTGEVNFTVSVGLSTLDSSDVSLAGLLERADRALYNAKEAGRNQVAVL